MIWTSKKNTSILVIKKSITTFYKNMFLKGLHFFKIHDLAQDMLNPLINICKQNLKLKNSPKVPLW
jgi:hypothetical protein